MIMKHVLLGLSLVGSLAVLAAPVVAGAGWLLLAPPELPGHGEANTKFEVNAPLDRWRQVQAFDTATQCEYDKDNSWSHALKEVETLLPYPPYPKPPKTEAPPKDKTLPELGRRRGLMEMIDDILKEHEEEEAMMTEEQKLKRDQALQKWRKAGEQIDAAREPKRREINERYRHWKCVPADAVYRSPK